jgi:hypothetical protein
METVIDIERRHLRRFLDRVVISEFYKRKQIESVVLFIAAENAEVGFQSLIHVLSLAIRLRVKSR